MLPIVYQDSRVLVLDKPSGLLAVPGRGTELQDCLSSRVQAEFAAALVIHRLDRDTSGLMLMALDLDAQRAISRQFELRTVSKRYIAVVNGEPADDSGVIELPMRKDFDHPPRHMIDPVQGRSAETHWRVVQRSGDRTRLEIEPRTGRSHQIRLHLATIGLPILGDNLYADETARAMSPRLLLHAEQLAIDHPDDGRRVSWRVPCPF
ncbi:MAG: RluA family pseudouridine synthase [Planctomycetaceae bacterium]|nr:RluA family pseudouridine synthase [Planctomycetaceae bacterium]